jgi:ABC-type nitrate/sulfonate/bicarbonate transport system substrate-binding protein
MTVSEVDTTATDVWYTRCAVPTASGLANHLGWLEKDVADRGHRFGILQDGPAELDRHHFDHELPGLIREGGSVPAIAARAEGAPTRLIGLTWIDELQSIIVRPDSGISAPEHLAGARVAIPAWTDRRVESFNRSMSLQGIAGALKLGGLTLDDVKLVEAPSPGSFSSSPRRGERVRFWTGLDLLEAGAVDAVYVKGSFGYEEARAAGGVIGINLDEFPDLSTRVNNGTPRPITVHESLLADHPDIVVGFLAQSLRAAAWALDDPNGVREALRSETWANEADTITAAYGTEVHRSLEPSLSEERLRLLTLHKDFLYLHGFLAHDFDVADWVDFGPLKEATAWLAETPVPSKVS